MWYNTGIGNFQGRYGLNAFAQFIVDFFFTQAVHSPDVHTGQVGGSAELPDIGILDQKPGAIPPVAQTLLQRSGVNFGMR